MADVTIYHNPRCSTSKAAVETARASSVDAEIVQYLKNSTRRRRAADPDRAASGSAHRSGPPGCILQGAGSDGRRRQRDRPSHPGAGGASPADAAARPGQRQFRHHWPAEGPRTRIFHGLTAATPLTGARCITTPALRLADRRARHHYPVRAADRVPWGPAGTRRPRAA